MLQTGRGAPGVPIADLASAPPAPQFR